MWNWVELLRVSGHFGMVPLGNENTHGDSAVLDRPAARYGITRDGPRIHWLSGRVFVDQDGGRAVGVPDHAGAVLDPGHIGHCGAMMCSVSVTCEVSQCRAWFNCSDAGVTVPLNLVGQAVVPRKVTPSTSSRHILVADQSHSPPHQYRDMDLDPPVLPRSWTPLALATCYPFQSAL